MRPKSRSRARLRSIRAHGPRRPDGQRWLASDYGHVALGLAIASLSAVGMPIAALCAVGLYVAYQYAGYWQKRDTLSWDIKTLALGYGAGLAGGIVYGIIHKLALG